MSFNNLMEEDLELELHVALILHLFVDILEKKSDYLSKT